MRLRQMFPVAALLTLTFALVPQADAADRGATLYADSNFRGGSERVRGDIDDLDDLRIGRDRASSIRVDRGCQARLYEGTGFRGPYIELRGEIRDLGRTELGNDRARSVRVRCGWYRVWGDDDRGRDDGWGRGDRDDRYDDDRDDRYGDDRHGDDRDGGGYGWRPPPYAGKPQGRGVVLFRDTDFRGASEVVYGDIPSLRGGRVGNDEVSSIELDRGCFARLFDDADFRGRYVETRESIDDLRRTELGNDRLSSIQVRCRPWRDGGHKWGGITLFEDGDFRGRYESFSRDVRRLGDTKIGNDAASSIEVDPGCVVVLYEDEDFRGRSVELGYDVGQLRETPVGNDRVSSLRVNCR